MAADAAVVEGAPWVVLRAGVAVWGDLLEVAIEIIVRRLPGEAASTRCVRDLKDETWVVAGISTETAEVVHMVVEADSETIIAVGLAVEGIVDLAVVDLPAVIESGRSRVAGAVTSGVAAEREDREERVEDGAEPKNFGN